MKKLILLELALLFLATTFQSNNPPGWYQQTIPRTDVNISGIFFIDNFKGWVAARRYPEEDSTYIFYTSNSGKDWITIYSARININVIQFLDAQNGFAAGGDGSGKVLSTSDGGYNWTVYNLGLGTNQIQDMQFINIDTGWICSNNLFDGGVFKTTNGGVNWTRLTSAGYFTKLFFLNKDTGWVNYNGSQIRLYRTTNGGTNWDIQFVSQFNIESIFFLNPFNGWIRGGYLSNTMGIAYTTDGGFTWTNAEGEVGGFDIKFINDSIGYSGAFPNKITKSINGGKYWIRQSSPIANNLSLMVLKNDSLHGWAGGSGIVHTTDGGGITSINSNIKLIPKDFVLNQNYPNPFNPKTVISYELQVTSEILIKVFDISGKEISTLVNEKQHAGSYKISFDTGENSAGGNLSSGIYFYSMYGNGKLVSTKKMILIR